VPTSGVSPWALRGTRVAEAESQPQSDLLGRLVRELERRLRIEDPAGRRALDVQIAEIADQVALALQQPLREESTVPPPRRVAVALGLALHSAPHFVATVPRPHRDGTVNPDEPARRAPDPVPVLTNEVYERALGLGQWEVDELREDIDRRAGKVLKQIRTVNWLWSFFGLPAGGQTLARILFPGVEDIPLELVRRGGHIYLLMAKADPCVPAAMYLPWLASDPLLAPTSFQSRGVDRGLRNRIARGIGADDDEVAEILEDMIALLPGDEVTAHIHLDQWRSHGYAAITEVGSPYSAGEWLIRPIAADGAEWRAWLKVGENGLFVRGTPEKVFDALALPRVTAMVRLVYAAMLASLDRDGKSVPEGVRPDDVDLYDLPRHMRAVLSPLLAWAGKSSTHKFLAKELARPVEEVTVVLEQVRHAWTTHAATSWYGPPGTKTPSIQTLVLEHVVALHQSLRRLMCRPSDRRSEHADIMLLFTAHYLREARLERLWVKSLSDCAEEAEPLPPPEDIVSHWFWRAWMRVLNEAEDQDTGRNTGGH
jgi:hypothetical protein